MPSSMTGFGQASFSDNEMSADVVVRCINGKHLKTKVILGINMPVVTERIIELVPRHLSRGTVDVHVRLDWAGAGGVAFNERIMASYVAELERLRKKLGLSSELQVDRIALLPGAMVADGVSNRAAEHVWRKLKPAITEALQKAARMRASEGRALTAELRRSCSRLNACLVQIKARVPEGLEQYRDRLTRRVSALLERTGTALDPASLTREIIMHAERADIAEELVRMKAHVDHFTDTIKGEGVGRKLEFIAQEMHREANTMASKATDAVMTELIIDLRGEVDKIREQVLNLE